MITSRFATFEEVFNPEFLLLNQRLNELHENYGLQEHSDLNKARFHWLDQLNFKPLYYASRLWEFPFAIMSANLERGLKVADVGCGNTPFTAFLAKEVGPDNVTGYDPDYIEDASISGHSHFGARKSYVESLGINFYPEGITKMTAADNYFDRVFCISVLEHIEDISEKQKGIKEMVRILKPGGRLVLTFDLGIQMPLNNIFDIIQYSGLIPYGCMDLKFPKRRFVDYGNGSNVDVFGLVLDKCDENIYTDHSEKSMMPQHMAYRRYAKLAEMYAVRYSSILAARDLDSRLGSFKVFIKSLLKRY